MLSIPSFIVPSSIDEARQMQAALRHQVRLHDEGLNARLIAGVDVGYDTNLDQAHASIVVMPIDTLQVIEQVQALAPAEFPYVPGFLSFREIPAILAALSKLRHTPQLLMVDGQGIAHPRRLGIASHLGVLLDMPSIGVAKSLLTGSYNEPDALKGSSSPLVDKGEQLGTVLRSRENVKPLFISPGHRVSIEAALHLTLRCITRYRLPEPTRMADKFSKYKHAQFKGAQEMLI